MLRTVEDFGKKSKPLVNGEMEFTTYVNFIFLSFTYFDIPFDIISPDYHMLQLSLFLFREESKKRANGSDDRSPKRPRMQDSTDLESDATEPADDGFSYSEDNEVTWNNINEEKDEPQQIETSPEVWILFSIYEILRNMYFDMSKFPILQSGDPFSMLYLRREMVGKRNQ